MKRAFRWFGIGVAAIVGLLLLATAVGAFLPEDHVAATRAVHAASPAEVWEAIADVAASPAWRSDLDRVEVLSADRWVEHGEFGATAYETVESDPPRRRVVRIADPELPYGGRWVYEIEPADGGTALTITEEGEVYNPFFRFMSRFVFGHHAAMEGVQRDLGRRFGAAEVAVERVR